MRSVRIIHCANYKYKYISVAQSATKMAVRILIPTNQETNCDGSKVLETDSILWKVLNINEQAFQVLAEGIFDLDNPLHRSWFQPNANICFVVNDSLSRGRLGVVPIRMLCADGERTPDWCNRTGHDVVAQLYCWSATDSITDSPASFAAPIDGEVYTNINPERIRNVDTDWMKREDRSAFLQIFHHVHLDVKENSILLRVECKDNEGNPIPVNGIYKLEATAGYFPVNEIYMNQGKCEFVWIPLGIKSGEITIRLKDSQNYTCQSLTFSLNK